MEQEEKGSLYILDFGGDMLDFPYCHPFLAKKVGRQRHFHSDVDAVLLFDSIYREIELCYLFGFRTVL